MIAIYQSVLDEIKKVWKVCGYDISDQEIFDMFEEVEEDDE